MSFANRDYGLPKFFGNLVFMADHGSQVLVRLGQIVRARREELDLRQDELADRGGPSTTTMTKIENGTGEPAPVTLRKLDVGLRWERGSARRVLRGGDPTPLAAPSETEDARPAGLAFGDSVIRILKSLLTEDEFGFSESDRQEIVRLIGVVEGEMAYWLPMRQAPAARSAYITQVQQVLTDAKALIDAAMSRRYGKAWDESPSADETEGSRPGVSRTRNLTTAVEDDILGRKAPE